MISPINSFKNISQLNFKKADSKNISNPMPKALENDTYQKESSFTKKEINKLLVPFYLKPIVAIKDAFTPKSEKSDILVTKNNSGISIVSKGCHDMGIFIKSDGDICDITEGGIREKNKKNENLYNKISKAIDEKIEQK